MPFPTAWSSTPWAQPSGSHHAPHWRVWEFYAAAMEREIVGGGPNSSSRFPRPSPRWFVGAADEITVGPSGTSTVKVSNWARIGVKPPPASGTNPAPVDWPDDWWMGIPAIDPGTVPQWPDRFDLILEDADLDPRDAARYPITGNTSDELTVSDPLATASGCVGRNAFIVQRLNEPPRSGLWWWDRSPAVPVPSGSQSQPWDEALAWYRAHFHDAYYTHDGTGETGEAITTRFPALTTTIIDSGAPGGTREVDIFDVDDAREDYVDDENPFGPVSTPNLYKSWRGLQVWAEGTCRTWVPPEDYDGVVSIPTFAVATFFSKNGIGWSTTATIPASGDVTVPVPSGFYDRVDEVHWALVERSPDLKSVLAEGRADVVGSYSHDGAPWVSDGTACEAPNLGDKDRILYLAAGWTRRIDAEVRYLYASTWFDPEIGEDGEPVEPTLEAPGSWRARPASTHNLEYTAHGYPANGSVFPATIPVSPSGAAPSGYVRYAGDRRNEDHGPDVTTDHALAWADYEVKKGDWNYTAGERAMMSGLVVASGTRGQIRTDRDFWRWGPGLTLTSTPTSVSTTTITDTTSATTYAGLWISTGRYLGHTVRILQPGGGPLHDTRRRITTFDPAGTLGFDAVPGLASTYLDALGATQSTTYEIVEPRHRLNFWQGRTLVLVTPSGERTFPIVGNDDECLYFDDPAPAPTIAASGWAFRIESFEPGQCVRRLDGAWVPVPSGLDPHGVIPAQLTRYGRARKWDTFHSHVPNELQRAINSLRWKKRAVIWENSEDRVTTYANAKSASDGYVLASDWDSIDAEDGVTKVKENREDLPGVYIDATHQWGAGSPVTTSPGAPGAGTTLTMEKIQIGGDINGGDGSFGATAARGKSTAFALGVPNGFPGKRLTSTVELYVVGSLGPAPDLTATPDPFNPRDWSRVESCLTTSLQTWDLDATFDDHGDFGGNLVQDRFALVHTGTGTDEDRHLGTYGGFSLPAWPSHPYAADPTAYDQASTAKRFRGYRIVDAVAIVKFDDALRFVAPSGEAP